MARKQQTIDPNLFANTSTQADKPTIEEVEKRPTKAGTFYFDVTTLEALEAEWLRRRSEGNKTTKSAIADAALRAFLEL